jgi:hypothetical protein
VEHLQVCESCRERLDAEIEFVTAMRGAAAKIRRVNVNRKGGHESEKDSQANSQD